MTTGLCPFCDLPSVRRPDGSHYCRACGIVYRWLVAP